MRPSLTKLSLAIFDDCCASVRFKIFVLYGVLIAANLLAWAWAFASFHDYPLLVGTALLAYGFGLRHAVDADHIAAIDNVTRKLMQEGQVSDRGGILLRARPLDRGHLSLVFDRVDG
jgi:high-affinity nickel permease